TSHSLAAAAAAVRPPLAPAAVAEWAERYAGLAAAARTAAKDLARAIADAKKAIDKADPRKVSACFRELGRLEEALREACAAQPFLEGWAYAHVHDLTLTERVGAPEGDTQAQAAFGLEREGRMADVLAQAAEELDRVLTEISNRMSSSAAMAR